MSAYYEQLLKEINKDIDKETSQEKIILGEITAYQAYNLIVRNIEEDNKEDYISFNLETFKAKKDNDYIEISSNAKAFFKKLIKEKCFVKRLIIFPDNGYQKILEEEPSLPNTLLPTYNKKVWTFYEGDYKATNAIKTVFNALVLDITEICFKEGNHVLLKGISNYNKDLPLRGYVVCCFYKPSFMKCLTYHPETLVDKEYWSMDIENDESPIIIENPCCKAIYEQSTHYDKSNEPLEDKEEI